MKAKHSILNNFIVASTTIIFIAVILVGYFTTTYMSSITRNHEEQLVISTANHIANSLQEQLNFIISNANLVKTDLQRAQKDNITIYDILKQHSGTSLPFISNMYYLRLNQKDWISPIELDLTNEAIDAIAQLDKSQHQSTRFSANNTTAFNLTYSFIYKMNDNGSDLFSVDVDLAKLNTFINSLNYNESLSVLVVDENNTIMLSDIKTDYDLYQQLFDPMMSHILSSDIATRITLDKANSYYIHSVGLSSVGWKLIAYSNTDILASETDTLPYFFIGFIAIILIIMFGVTTLLWGKMTSALNKIIAEIHNIRNEKYGSILSDVPVTELHPITDAFNDMSLELESTINKKLEAERTKQHYEYKALLAQVNPHFLYNSLNSINALLDLERYEDIRCVNGTIISLLSYSIGKNGQIITIGEELTLVEQYVAMQKIRYNNRFSLKVALSDEVKEKALLHMTIMPLIENAIFHGFADKNNTAGQIHITGYITSDHKDIVLTITDNGSGITKERLDHILVKPHEEEINPYQNRYVRIGVRNVHERLEMCYGSGYGLSIYSTYGEGTTVEILIPNNCVEETPSEAN